MPITNEQELELRKKWEEEFHKRLKEQSDIIEEKKRQRLVPNRNSYMLVVLLMAVLVVGAIVLLEIFSDITKNNTATIGALIAFGTALTLQLIQIIKSEEIKIETKEATSAAKETYHLFNSRMSDALENAAKAAYGEGRKDGRQEAEIRADAQAVKLADAQTVTQPVEIVKATGIVPVEIVEGK